MSDFTVAFSLGTTLETWTDPADVARPSRLNPTANRGHKRRLGEVGTQVEIRAVVGGVSAPLDSALAGRLFLCMFAECPAAPAITSPAGQSSVQSFTPAAPGHYCFVMRRAGGGGVFMHLDVL